MPKSDYLNFPQQNHFKLFGKSEFILLIEKLSDPVFIIDTVNKVFNYANTNAINYCGYSLSELMGENYEKIIIFPEDFYQTGNNQIQLKTRLGNIQNLSCEIFPLTDSDSIEAIICKSIHNVNEFNASRWIDLISRISKIQNRFSTIDKEGLLIEFARVCQDFYLSDEINCYINKENGNLKRIFPLGGSSYPDQFQSIEVDRIKKAEIWEPGKRILSEINRASRQKNFACAVSIPILDGISSIGLILVSFLAKPVNVDLNSSTDAIEKSFSAIMTLHKQFMSINKTILDAKSRNNLLDRSFKDSRDGILIIDNQNRIVDSNPAFFDIFGYSPVEILGRDINVVVNLPRNNHEEIENAIVFNNLELSFNNGKKITVNVKIIQAGDDQSKILIFNDQSEIIALHTVVDRLQRAATLGEGVSEFAHDVRNIINRIDTGLQLLNRKVDGVGDNQDLIQGIRNECDAMTEYMDSILSISRQDKEKFISFDLQDVISRIIHRLQKKADKNGINIILNTSASNCLTWGDPRSIERAISNLISNGIDAIGTDGGTVSIRVVDENNSILRIYIADTGPGISQEIKERIYEKFTSGKVEGTGLGLFITKKLIEFHHGKIDLDTFPGGTIFSIQIPKCKGF